MASVAISHTDAAASRNGNVESTHVLVVDDDPINRKLVEIMLKKSSCKVTTAANGWKALEYLGLINDHKKSSKNGIASYFLEISTKFYHKMLSNYSAPNPPSYVILRSLFYTPEADFLEYSIHQIIFTCNAQTLKVNMIITDYEMPAMTGYNLLKKVKKSSITKHVHVVIMSSDSIPARVIRCLDDGALVSIPKTVDKSNIEKLISRMTQ